MSDRRRLIVVGNGMAGARFVEDALARGGRDRFALTVFGEERHGNYNRILLSGVLAGNHQAQDILINPLSWYAEQGVTLHAGARVDEIDIEQQRVSTSSGIVESYDVLVLATGSRCVLPPIEGLTSGPGTLKEGAFVFRTLDDCDAIAKRAETSRRAVVIGGGLLGLEAARGLLNRGLEVHVLHLMPHVMETQLDSAAGAILLRELERMGMRVHLEKTARAVLGETHVTGVELKNREFSHTRPAGGPAETVDCDLVVVAAGVRPNIELARRAGLDTDRGILVDDDLACRPACNVYGIGECVQHRGRTYGLVAPVWEQAQVLADRLTGRNPRARYEGSKTSTKLKVAGVSLAVMGDKEPVEEDDEVVSYAEPARGVYKKLIVRDNRLAGAIVMGDGAIVPRLIQVFRELATLADDRVHLLFPRATASNVPPPPEQISDDAQICDCNAVSKAQIVEAVLKGARSVQAVSDVTRACTGCGTCRPQVQLIVELAARNLPPAEVAAPAAREFAPAMPAGADVVVTTNKIERFKKEKDGLDILSDIPQLAGSSWQAIDEGDRERLKWAGVFFRRQTPGHFMMRVRMSNGLTNAAQIRAIAEMSREFGPGFTDITTRQQIQLRGFEIGDVPRIWDRLHAVGLVSLQTGMDNIRNVAGCPVAGLTSRELFDATPVVKEFTETFLRNKEFTNLPRKFNVTITGCTEHCTHAESQDLALIPAVAMVDGRELDGFNVLVGGKMGSGGFQAARSIDVFVPKDEAAALSAQIVLIFRDHGSRTARNRARLAFLIDAWGPAKFRAELERRVGRPLRSGGRDARGSSRSDHLGIQRQQQPGLSYVGLAVAVGRITVDQMFELARLAETYGSGDLRLTTGQNVIIPNVSEVGLERLVREPLLSELRHDPHPAVRGLVSCTGIDYCHFALIETKDLAVKTAQHLERVLPHDLSFTTHWSGCPAGCGNHVLADIGLLGKNIRVDGKSVDAVDVFIGGRSGAHARPGTKILEDVPCEDLPEVLDRVIPYISKRRRAPNRTASTAPRPNQLSSLRASSSTPSPRTVSVDTNS